MMLAHLVDELAGLDRPHPGRRPLDPAQRAERVRVRARDVADRAWGEAFAAGAAYGLSISAAPVRILIDPSGGPDDEPEPPKCWGCNHVDHPGGRCRVIVGGRHANGEQCECVA